MTFDNGAGATLNRVTGHDPSLILGQVSATGSVYVINPQGVVVGPSGVVSTGGRFVASARDATTRTNDMNHTTLEPVKRDPDGTRRRILHAATEQFTTLGLAGARIDAIAKLAGTNERMLYYYFGNKEEIYVAVLESMYKDFADSESHLELAGLEPRDALASLAKSMWAHLWDSPGWLGLINSENLHQCRYLKSSHNVRATISPVVEVVSSILGRGVATGELRDGADPLDVYVTLVAMGYYIASNRFTIIAFTGRDYSEQGHREHITKMHLEMLLGHLCQTDRSARPSQSSSLRQPAR